MAGPATFTDRPLARNSPVPMAPPSAIVVCCAVESWRASPCSLATAGWSAGAAMAAASVHRAVTAPAPATRGCGNIPSRVDPRRVPGPISDLRPPRLREQLLAGRAVARRRGGAGGLHRVVAHRRLAVGSLGRRGRAAAHRLCRLDWRRRRRNRRDAERLDGHRRDRHRARVRHAPVAGSRWASSSSRPWRTSGSPSSGVAPRSTGCRPAARRCPSRPTRRASTSGRWSCRRRTSASATATGSTSRRLAALCRRARRLRHARRLPAHRHGAARRARARRGLPGDRRAEVPARSGGHRLSLRAARPDRRGSSRCRPAGSDASIPLPSASTGSTGRRARGGSRPDRRRCRTCMRPRPASSS